MQSWLYPIINILISNRNIIVRLLAELRNRLAVLHPGNVSEKALSEALHMAWEPGLLLCVKRTHEHRCFRQEGGLPLRAVISVAKFLIISDFRAKGSLSTSSFPLIKAVFTNLSFRSDQSGIT